MNSTSNKSPTRKGTKLTKTKLGLLQLCYLNVKIQMRYVIHGRIDLFISLYYFLSSIIYIH